MRTQVYWQGQAVTAYTNKSYYGTTQYREISDAVAHLGKQGGGVVLNEGTIDLYHRDHIDPPDSEYGIIADVTIVPGTDPVDYVVAYGER